jgi:hypothetical protein
MNNPYLHHETAAGAVSSRYVYDRYEFEQEYEDAKRGDDMYDEDDEPPSLPDYSTYTDGQFRSLILENDPHYECFLNSVKYVLRLTEQQRKAIFYYTWDETNDINLVLLGVKRKEDLHPDVQVYMDTLIGIIENAPVVTEPFVVYRGYKYTDGFDKLFISTSLDKHISINLFMTADEGRDIGTQGEKVVCCLHTIYVLPGAKCLFIPSKYTPGAFSNYDEYEILFGPNLGRFISLNRTIDTDPTSHLGATKYMNINEAYLPRGTNVASRNVVDVIHRLTFSNQTPEAVAAVHFPQLQLSFGQFEKKYSSRHPRKDKSELTKKYVLALMRFYAHR